MVSSQPGSNFYAAARNDPAVLARRERRLAEVDAKVAAIFATCAGRAPRWRREEVEEMDAHCLREGLRCVMWDDADGGFYLLLDWDWVEDAPAGAAGGRRGDAPPIDPPVSPGDLGVGSWQSCREVLGLPLVDPGLAEDEVGAWLDAHTMRIHARLQGASARASIALPDPTRDPPELSSWAYILRGHPDMPALLTASQRLDEKAAVEDPDVVSGRAR